MNPPDFTIRCSCGRQTTIHWQPSEARYFTLTPGWHPSYPAGWTCGRAGHQQYVPPQPVEAKPVMLPELKITL